MAYIPDNGILRTRKTSVQGNRKLHNAKVACKMSAVMPYNFYNLTADFFCQ